MREYLRGLRLLLRAFRYRRWGRAAEVRLDPVAADDVLPVEEERARLAAIAERVAGLVFWRRRRCFYRSYILASLLRQAGVPAALNLGYDGLFGERSRRRAHCWVTIEGRAVAEAEDVAATFTEYLGERGGGVHYWVSDGKHPARLQACG